MVKQRVRCRFEKKGEVCLISHHDLMRLFERAARRAELPLAFTEGFNPHPRMSFPLALGVGIAGLREIVEMDLSAWLHPAEIQRRLNAQLPEGLRITECRAISPRDTAQVASVAYEIQLSAPLPEPNLLDRLRQAKELRVIRQKENEQREIDLRPYLLDIQGEGQTLRVQLKVTPSGSARPEEVVAALAQLAQTPLSCVKITRTQVNIAADAGAQRTLRRYRV